MKEPGRREEREEKRLVKRLGGKLRRRELKRRLEENPDEAPHDEVDFGRLSSTPWNGLDQVGRPSREGKDR